MTEGRVVQVHTPAQHAQARGGDAGNGRQRVGVGEEWEGPPTPRKPHQEAPAPLRNGMRGGFEDTEVDLFEGERRTSTIGGIGPASNSRGANVASNVCTMSRHTVSAPMHSTRRPGPRLKGGVILIGRGGLGPKILCTKISQINLPFGKFHSFANSKKFW